jgi:NAD(P)-dependent dehydrogenase (short-subunit alcohol dehydrogenase family)
LKDFRGKVAVVTGSGNGIGRAIAKKLHDEGMKVVLADIEESALKEAADAIGGGDDVLTVQTDVSSLQDIQRLADATIDRFGGVHVLCNNAGVNAYGFTVWEAPDETWNWVFGVNIWGVIYGIRVFLPLMMKAGEGHIVNTGSGATLISAPLRSAYAASKHAVYAISESLHAELSKAESPVKISLFIPGRHKTTIRDSSKRWPKRLGDVAALGPDGLNSSMPMTTELGAEDPSTAAETVFEALNSGRFLAMHHSKTGYAAMATRLNEMAGLDPVL